MATRRERDRRPLLISAVFVLLFTSGLGAWPHVVGALCPSILIASSDEKSTLLSQLAVDYSASHGSLWSGCGPVVTVEDVASGDAEQRLEADWPGAGRPDVWSPAATTWVLLLQNKRSESKQPDLVPAGQLPSIASSPLVVAMPDLMARALNWPSVQPSWKQLLLLANDPQGWGKFGHPDWGPFRLGKTDPRVSTSGMNSLIAEYYAATSKSSNLTLDDTHKAQARTFVSGVEKSVSHYAPTAGSFLENLAQAPNPYTYISAVAVEEQEVYSYNAGGYRSQSPKIAPTVTLDAVYPAEGTLVEDHPFVVLRGPWVNAAKQKLANDFLQWLQLPDQQRRFTDAGFRNFRAEATIPLTKDLGIIRDIPTGQLKLPSASVVAAVQASWGDLRKPARVVLILDLTNAVERNAVQSSLKELSDRDQLAVLEIQQDQALQCVTPDSLQDGGRDQALAAIGKVRMRAHSGELYTTIESAYMCLSSTFDARFINAVVVIASHRDDGSGPTLANLEHDIGNQADRTPVRIYTVALPGSDSQALLGVEKASGGVPSSSSGNPDATIRTCLGNF